MNLYAKLVTPSSLLPYWADPIVRVANCVRAWCFPRRKFRIETFRVAVTNICNAACCFCTYPQTVMKGKVMSLDTFLKALEYVDPLTVLDLTPAVGDPLVDPGLKEKILAAGNAGLVCQFTTNGILLEKHDWILDPEYSKHIANIFFSVPGFDQDCYKVQFGVDKGREMVVALHRFLRLHEQAGQPIRVRVQVRNREHESQTLNHSSYSQFEKFFHGRVTLHFTKIWDNWSWALDLSTWSEHMKKRLRWCPQIKRPCRNLRFGLVNPDGGLRLCGCRVVGTDQDDLLVGKLGDSVGQLNSAAVTIRNGFYSGRFPKACQKCSFYNPE